MVSVFVPSVNVGLGRLRRHTSAGAAAAATVAESFGTSCQMSATTTTTKSCLWSRNALLLYSCIITTTRRPPLQSDLLDERTHARTRAQHAQGAQTNGTRRQLRANSYSNLPIKNTQTHRQTNMQSGKLTDKHMHRPFTVLSLSLFLILQAFSFH